jgi:hypothetical protein
VVTLSDDEARAVARLVDKYLPEMDYELARIKLERDRQPLVDLERVLVALRKRL